MPDLVVLKQYVKNNVACLHQRFGLTNSAYDSTALIRQLSYQIKPSSFCFTFLIKTLLHKPQESLNCSLFNFLHL